MKGTLLVIFHSKHGYVKRYVDIIGNALGCDAVPLDKLHPDMLGAYDKLLFISSVRNDEIFGIKKLADFYDAIYTKLTVCGVGMTPFRHDKPARLKETSVSVSYEKFIPVFYAQGGFDVKELSRLERMPLDLRVKQARLSNFLTDDDGFIINAMTTPVDEVKQSNIQPLIDYLDGKDVDEKLFSPAEITDPEEIKKFFEEQKAAAAPPPAADPAKSKDLRKKLLK